jgi:spermidine synthase
MSNTLGRHVLVELYDCRPEALKDVQLIEQSMVRAAQDSGATVINATFHHFSPFGASGVVVIQESHLAIHTWPEYGYAAVDLFTCGDTVDPWRSYAILKEALGAQNGSAMEMLRGQLSLLTEGEIPGEQVSDEAPAETPQPRYQRNIWFTDRDENIALSLRHKGDLLFRRKSPYQRVEVYDTYAYGKMLAVDNIVMTTEKDEFIYHEMIAHVPMLTHPNPRRVLVIGGGDGGSIREVLRHESVEEVVMVEIDEEVINASQEHLPQLSQAFDHPKLTLRIEDGIAYARQAESHQFDIVLVDSSDPVGPSEGLFTPSFYRDTHRLLTEQGVLVVQSESPQFNMKAFKDIYATLEKQYGRGKVHPYLFFVPTYPTGMWSFTYASKGTVDPVEHYDTGRAKAFLEQHPMRYYNIGVHYGAFSLPNFVKEMLEHVETPA